MGTSKLLIGALIGALLALPFAAQAGEGDWKRGRVYYRMVCTACHAENGGTIAPSTRTKAEWAAYLQADKHAKGKDSLKHYWSLQYRNSIKAGNKAAEKYADVPDAALQDDLRAFVMKGAKDGDSPASCS